MVEVILLGCLASEVSHKTRRCSHLAFSGGTRAFGALSYHVRSLATLRLPCWRDHEGRSHGPRDATGVPAVPAQEPDVGGHLHVQPRPCLTTTTEETPRPVNPKHCESQ